jgi:molybdate transport system ATP-binding protein
LTIAPARRELACRFRLDRPRFSLDVDLVLPGRGVTAIFGPSGSGKTTLLRCIAGLERAPGGRLQLGDETWQDGGRWVPTHLRPLGYVFQEASLFPHLSVAGNLRYGERRSPAARRRNLEASIELLGLASLLERAPGKLSGGERQRVAIARALATAPRLLLMDEPLAALDAARKREILPYLERLHDELDIPVLYVSHAADEVARLADHLVLLDGGRVRASGRLTDLLQRLDLPLALGEDVGTVLEGAIDEIDATWHLARVGFPGGVLWTRDHGLPVGQRVRVRVLARDVSLARAAPLRTSIQNVFEGWIDAVADDEHPSSVVVRLCVGPSRLLARVTKRAAVELDIVPGREIWVQVKSVALLE